MVQSVMASGLCGKNNKERMNIGKSIPFNFYYGHPWWYRLRDNNAKLEVALDSKDAVINELQNNMKKQIELSNELNTKLAAAEQENTKIRDKLAEGNLVADSLADPKVMEQKINEEVSTIFGSLSNSTK